MSEKWSSNIPEYKPWDESALRRYTGAKMQNEPELKEFYVNQINASNGTARENFEEKIRMNEPLKIIRIDSVCIFNQCEVYCKPLR